MSVTWQQRTPLAASPPSSPPTGNATAPVAPTAPLARYGHTTALDVDNTTLLVYGGVDTAGQYLDDIWSLNTSSLGWTPVRIPSFQRQPTTAAPDLHTVQPSARAFTHWRPFVTSFGALRRLPAALQTANLVAFLNWTTGARDTSPLTTLLLYGGRSSPADIYSTEWSNQPLNATYLTAPSTYAQDWGDQWLYVHAADTWLRVGNVTCTEQQTVCTDYTDVSALSPSISPLLDQLTALTLQPSRPAGLLNRTMALLNVTVLLDALLYGVDTMLRSDPALTTNNVDSCTTQCLVVDELPSPTVTTPPPQCAQGSGGNQGVSVTNSGSVFCNSSSVGNVITQTRPNATEGAATATHVLVNGSDSLSYVWSFGGFGCASNGVNIFAVTTWPSECFVQALSVLSPITLVWYTFTPPSVLNSQSVLWPSGRAYASMAIDQSSGLLWLYGGASISSGAWSYYNDLYAFDIAQRAWVTTVVTSTSPAIGLGASFVWLPATGSTPAGLYLYGGCAGTTYSSQVLLLETSSFVAAYNWQASGGALVTAVAGQETSFMLTAMAVDGNYTFTNATLNYAVGLSSQFAISIYTTDSAGTSFTEVSGLAPTELGDGQYAVNYTVNYGSQLSIAIGFRQLAGAFAAIPGSPFTLTLLPSYFSPNATVIASSNYSTVEKGTETFIVVQLRDRFNNDLISSPGATPPAFSMWYRAGGPSSLNALYPQCAAGTAATSGGVAVVPMTGNSNGGNGGSGGNSTDGNGTLPTDGSGGRAALYPLDVTAQDGHDGTFTLVYVVPAADAYQLYVLVDCDEMVGSPFSVTALNPLVLPTALQSAFLALVCILGSVVAALLVVLVLYRNNRVVRAGSPLFLALICAGVLLCTASVAVLAYPSSTNCRLFPFLLTTGYIVALAALCSKSYRVYLIFIKSELSSVALSDIHMLAPVLLLLCGETIINVVWLVVSPLDYHEYSDSANSVLTYHACGGANATAFIAASVAFNGLIALWGVWLAVQIRHVPEAFSESKLMGAALYNLALVMAITIPLTWTANDTQQNHEDIIIPAAAILWCCLVTTALVIAPKLYYIVYPPSQHFFDGHPAATAGTLKGSSERRASAAAAADKAAKRAGEADTGKQAGGAGGGVPASPAEAGGAWPSAIAAGVGSSPVSAGRVDTAPLQLAAVTSSSAAVERQHSAVSLQQVAIDIPSPPPPHPRVVSHEPSANTSANTATTTSAAGDAADGSQDGGRPEGGLSHSASPASAKRSLNGRAGHSLTLPAVGGAESHVRRYVTSPAVVAYSPSPHSHSRSYMAPPFITAPSPTSPTAATATAGGMRASQSHDDLSHIPTRGSTVHLPPGPPLRLSVSHTGSPRSSLQPLQQRVSLNGRHSPRGVLSTEQSSPVTLTRVRASTPTVPED